MIQTIKLTNVKALFYTKEDGTHSWLLSEQRETQLVPANLAVLANPETWRLTSVGNSLAVALLDVPVRPYEADVLLCTGNTRVHLVELRYRDERVVIELCDADGHSQDLLAVDIETHDPLSA